MSAAPSLSDLMRLGARDSDEYQQFDAAAALVFARALPDLPIAVGTSAAEIGDGNLNFLFRVGEHVLVKQAPPFVRVAPTWPLPAARARFEACAMAEFERAAPGACDVDDRELGHTLVGSSARRIVSCAVAHRRDAVRARHGVLARAVRCRSLCDC